MGLHISSQNISYLGSTPGTVSASDSESVILFSAGSDKNPITVKDFASHGLL